jgi:hypothetical protein
MGQILLQKPDQKRHPEATRIISHTPTCLAKAGQLHASGY